jgi:putative sterol carrier protein
VATVEECEKALHELAARLDGNHTAGPHQRFDRTLRCTLTDLDVTFTGRLDDGRLTDIAQGDGSGAQIGLSMSSDDLLRLVAGDLHLASAWATGRVRMNAGVRDLMRLRALL